MEVVVVLAGTLVDGVHVWHAAHSILDSCVDLNNEVKYSTVL